MYAIIEINDNQEEEIKKLLEENGYSDVLIGHTELPRRLTIETEVDWQLQERGYKPGTDAYNLLFNHIYNDIEDNFVDTEYLNYCIDRRIKNSQLAGEKD